MLRHPTLTGGSRYSADIHELPQAFACIVDTGGNTKMKQKLLTTIFAITSTVLLFGSAVKVVDLAIQTHQASYATYEVSSLR